MAIKKRTFKSTSDWGRLGISTLLACLVVAWLTHCQKEEVGCSDNTEFCSYVQAQNYPATGPLIDDFLKTLSDTKSDGQKMDDLRRWLECKSCVTKVEILCTSCIKTLPAQSELRVTFRTSERPTSLTLDIHMSEPPRFIRYHE